jgi:hypothetical protein
VDLIAMLDDPNVVVDIHVCVNASVGMCGQRACAIMVEFVDPDDPIISRCSGRTKYVFIVHRDGGRR